MEPTRKLRNRLFLVGGPVLLLLLGTWLCCQSITKGPVYGGRPWSYWQGQLRPNLGPDAPSPGFRLTDEAITYVQEVGATELDTVVGLIAKPTSGPKALFLGMLADDRIPDQVKPLLGLFIPRSYNPAVATVFFRALGPLANDAIPDLTAMLHVSDDSRWAALALSAISPAGIAALSKEFPLINDGIIRANVMSHLLRERGLAPFFATQLQLDRHAAVRMSAARNLGRANDEVKIAVPALIEALKDSDGAVRFTACQSLAQLGPAAEPAKAHVEALLQDPNSQVRTDAALALGAIQDALEQ